MRIINWLRRGGNSEARSLNDPSKKLTAQDLAILLDGYSGMEGIRPVNADSAVRFIAVRACVEAISTGVARMPIDVYRRETNGGRAKARDHWSFELLHNTPNSEQSSYRFRAQLMTDRALWGNGYAEIVRKPSGEAIELVRVEPRRVSVERHKKLGLLYHVTMRDGGNETITARDMVHVMGLSLDGMVGLSTIGTARLMISAGLSADEFMSRFVNRGMRPSGILKVIGTLAPDAIRRLRESFSAAYSGPENSGRPITLEQGQEFTPLSMSLEDAQFIQASKFRIEEIARLFRVPPHKIGHLESTPGGSIEAQDLAFLADTLDPYALDLEGELNRKLYSAGERKVYYCEHNRASVVSMDAAARSALYRALFGIGAMTPDEIRARENMNSAPDGRGATHFVPSNMMPAPSPEQADELLASWIKKGMGGNSERNPGQPEPETDDKHAKSD